jgi:hypothetical protein
MGLVVDAQMVGLFLFAAILATYIRIKDSPSLVLIVSGKVDWNAVAVLGETFLASVFAALLTAWGLAEQGVYITSITGFGTITLAAVAGMATVRAIINHIPAAKPAA